jgi:(1->4)-alpha-D-glucan 1-alpha-D-glucosylmutase
MSLPRATVRLQFNRDFTFDAAVEIVPYLARLGISHVYASPILAAAPGSTHGYDTIDPTVINPELGGQDGLARLTEKLRRHELGLIIDIVPNHMAAVAENPWWWDVLKSGRASRYADHFDIDWEDPDPELRGKVLLPSLGDRLEACLERGEITVERTEDGWTARYFDNRFPIDPKTRDGSDVPSEGELLPLLQRQNYVMASWREAATRINWRRFFDINRLIALRMDRDVVFADYHRLILELRRNSIIDGVRVDHVDGLAEPILYCRRLRDALEAAAPGRETYLVIEKILHSDERLSGDWAVHGTTGYDFLNEVAAVLHDPEGEGPLTDFWQQVSGDHRPFTEVARDARREILERLFPRQRERLIAAFGSGDEDVLRRVLTELLVAMRHYRLYGTDTGFDSGDMRELESAVSTARSALNGADAAALTEVCTLLPKTPIRQRFGQLSATLTAKSVEDTAFYRYSRLLSRNEVGGDPGEFAISVEQFHARALDRHTAFPAAILATATHDTKRGEDHRARLAVLSAVPDAWVALATRWAKDYPAPDPGVGLMIWQTVIGAWPPQRDLTDFQSRLREWLVKALREAKQRTAWDNPNEAFEGDCLNYLASLFDPQRGFLDEAEAFVAKIAPAGIRNSLSQTLLRLTMPGVPDLYQGTEFWDFSLVDPDNRRPVDFAARARALSEGADLATLLAHWQDGRVKQALIARLLGFRRQHPQLFAEGSYEPLAVSGPKAGDLIAFARRWRDEVLIIAAPRLTASADPDWRGTRIALPQVTEAENVLGSGKIPIGAGADAATLLKAFPLAALYCRVRPNGR